MLISKQPINEEETEKFNKFKQFVKNNWLQFDIMVFFYFFI